MALSSKVTVVEGEPGLRPIAAADSSVPAFVGVTERGPIAEPTLLTSFAQYRKIFGGFIAGANRDLPLAVLAFFANGGQSCYVSRVTHFTDLGDPSTSIAVASSATLSAGGSPSPAQALGGAMPLALPQYPSLEINAQSIIMTSSAAYDQTGAAPFALQDGDTLTLRTSPTAPLQTIVFLTGSFVDIGAATAQELANVINSKIVGGSASLEGGDVRISSDVFGSDSRMIIVGGTAAAALSFDGETIGAGDFANSGAVTAAEIQAAIDLNFPATFTVDPDADVLTIETIATGAAATFTIGGGTSDGFGLTADTYTGADDASVDVIRIDERHAAGLSFSAVVSDATSGEADRFDLVISSGGVAVESWRNLSADPSAESYIVDELTEATSIFSATHLGAAGDPRPDNQTATIQGGDSGLTGLADSDFVGGAGTGKTGLRSLDSVLDLSLLAIPGRASLEIATGLKNYCETTRAGTVFAVHDTPSGLSYSGAVTYCETTAGLLNLTEFGAVYWPHIKIANPSTAVFGSVTSLTVPPSGSILGLYARLDGRRDGGVYDSPAGWERAYLDAIGLEDESVNEEAVRDVLYPKRINPIHTGPGRPIYVDGGRTLKAGGNFPNIAERRGAILIKRSLKDGIDFARHQNHDASLRAAVRRAVKSFLRTQMLVGAFRSREEETAFYVVCDETNNTLDVILAGRLVCDVGIATQKPAEFVELSISQDTRGFAA